MGENSNNVEEDLERIQLRKMVESRNEKIKKVWKNGEIINGSSLDFELAFGINNKMIPNQMQMLGEGFVVFYSGHVIVVKDIQAKTYQFFNKENRLRNVTCLNAAITKKGNVIIAAGESSPNEEKPTTISITNSKKGKWIILTNPNLKGVFKHIGLNLEKKFCCSMIHALNTNMPYINFWYYKKEKLMASVAIKASFDRFTMHPVKTKNLVLSGNSYFRMWEIFFQEKQLKECHETLVTLKIEKENKFLDQIWVNLAIPTLLVLVSGNKIFMLQNDILKKIIDIDITNMNIQEVIVKEIVAEENDDMYNDIIEDFIKDKPLIKEPQTISGDLNEKGANQNIVEFLCLAPTRKGFIVGGTKGYICQYDIEKNNSEVNTLNFEMKIPDSPEDNRIVYLSCSVSDSQISIISLTGSKINFSILNTYEVDSEKSPIQPFFPSGFHTKRINSISCSACKSIFATCSEDNTVKIWNYYETENQERRGVISQTFKDEPLSLSLHPSGLFIAICFANCFKIFALLNGSFSQLKEVNLTNCKIVRYSHGGHFLVTNEKSNVMVFDTIYYENIDYFDGHTALIKDITVSEDDLHIISTCMNGYVYSFTLFEKNIYEHQESTIFNSIQYDHSNDAGNNTKSDYLIGCTNDKYLCIYRNHFKEMVVEFPTVDCYLTTLLVSRRHKAIFMGTNLGSIRVCIWPIRDETLEWDIFNPASNQVKFKIPDFFEIQAHSAPISTMTLSHDHQYLFSGAEDGTLFVYHIKEVDSEIVEVTTEKPKEALVENTKKTFPYTNMKPEELTKITHSINDLHLAKWEDILNRNDDIKKLNFKVLKSEQTIKIELQKLDLMFQQKLDQIDEEFQQTISSDKKMKETFEKNSNDEYSKLQIDYEREREQFSKVIEDLKVVHERRVDYEIERNKELEKKIEDLKDQHKGQLQQLLNQHKDDSHKLRETFQEKCEKIQIKYSSVVDKAKSYGNAFIQRLDKQDAEHEKDLDIQVEELQEDIAKSKGQRDLLEARNVKLLNENETLKNKDHELQKQFNELLEQHSHIRNQNLKNDEDIIKNQHQLLERLQVIDSKEETCKASRDEQINLENFRYMLDQKIKMLQQEKTQILSKISEREKNLKDMFNELIKESNQNDLRYQEYKKKLAEIDILENSVKKTDLDIFIKSNTLNDFQSDLLKIIKSPDRMNVMAQKLKDMLSKGKDPAELKRISSKKTITNDDINEILRITNEKGNDINDELLKQGKWLTNKLFLIDDTCKKLKDIREANIDAILNQNTKLIEECNILRSENERYKKLNGNVEKLLMEAIRKRTKLLKKKKENSPNLKKLVKKYEENSEKLKNQHVKLTNLKESMQDILLKSDSEEDATKLPPIKGKNSSIASSQNISGDASLSRSGPIKVDTRKGKVKQVIKEDVEQEQRPISSNK